MLHGGYVRGAPGRVVTIARSAWSATPSRGGCRRSRGTQLVEEPCRTWSRSRDEDVVRSVPVEARRLQQRVTRQRLQQEVAVVAANVVTRDGDRGAGEVLERPSPSAAGHGGDRRARERAAGHPRSVAGPHQCVGTHERRVAKTEHAQGRDGQHARLEQRRSSTEGPHVHRDACRRLHLLPAATGGMCGSGHAHDAVDRDTHPSGRPGVPVEAASDTPAPSPGRVARRRRVIGTGGWAGAHEPVTAPSAPCARHQSMVWRSRSSRGTRATNPNASRARLASSARRGWPSGLVPSQSIVPW